MKITLFTSNQNRHNYFINLLSRKCKELFVVQESKTIFPGIISGHYEASPLIKEYFSKVNKAQLELFGNSFIKTNKSINILPISPGDLSECSISNINDFLKSDLYIVFGSSYIKGDLAEFLISKNAINIHMGVSPYYRGTDCNFWALFDNNPHLVGATIHLLSKGLDSGPILYHALAKYNPDLFQYTMSTVKSALHSLADRINDKTILDIKPIYQTLENQIRYSKKNEFDEKILKKFYQKKIDFSQNKFDLVSFKDPYIIENIN